MTGSTVLADSVQDYMGIPPGTNPTLINTSALPFRCYNKIYNFWFRDENLCTAITEDTGDAPSENANYATVRRRRKRRDYITAGLPWPQKGPDVTVNLGGNADIKTQQNETGAIGIYSDAEGEFRNMDIAGGALLSVAVNAIGAASNKMYADLGNASGITINSLRESFQIQKLLERDARGGTRYPEILRSHFQVSDPALLVHQRPLYLGGGSTRININPVEQTQMTGTPATGTTPQGNLAAYGTVSATGHGFTSSFTEHGHIIGLVNVRADLTYQQGLERYWSRQTRFDFYWPALSHLGEQPVLNKEVFISNSEIIDDDVFSYMPRYDEYRYKQSQITGLFRSDATDSLRLWHLAQDFATLPSLNQAFIEDNPPVDRVVAVPTEPDMLLDVYFKIRAARPLPLYGTPGLIDHF